MFKWFAKNRITVSRILVLLSALTLIFTHHSWSSDGLFDLVVEGVGYSLLVVATFLRIWCSLYIYGYKGHSLVRAGPYSIVRNPLYVASLIGAFGLGLASENLLFLGLITFFFVFYYPFVVVNEERELLAVHGAEFEEYRRNVPRFIPNFKLFYEPERYEIHPRRVRKAFLDAMWFLWALIGFEIIESLHEHGLLPVVWHIP